MRVLLVEDDYAVSQSIETMLKKEGMVVDATDLGEDGLDIAKLYDYDIIILDLMLPDMNGYEVLKNLRSAKITTPVLILSGLSEPDKKVKGLGYGADDYLTKPFDKKELLARIRALTRTNEEEKEKFVIGNITFSKEDSELFNDKMVLKLNKEECDILEILAKNPQRSVFKDELCSRIFENSDNTNDEALNIYMSFLKDKFEALGSDSIMDILSKKISYYNSLI